VETTPYYSDADSGNFQESGTILTLAEATWQGFARFLSKYQWAFDDPSHSPRKAELRHAIENRGQNGCCTFYREEGYKYVLPVLHPRHFEKSINEKRKVYYVSYGRQALLYFDIDLHQAWQTEEEGEKAKRLIDALLHKSFGESVLFWSLSSRGVNGYLKVDLQGMAYTTANLAFTRLENALQRFLAFTGNFSDFEIKGKVGFLGDDETYTWKQYGKLPIHSAGWNFARLEEFQSKPVVSIRRLEVLCSAIERQVPQEVLDRHQEDKRSQGEELRWDGDWFLVPPAMAEALRAKHGDGWRFMFMCQGSDEATWMDREYYQRGKLPELMSKDEWQKRKMETLNARKRQHELGGLQAVAEGTQGANRPDEEVERQAGRRHAGPGTGGTTNSGGVPLSARGHKKPPVSRPIHLNLSDLIAEQDSFLRQKEALFRLARYLKRVPSLEEGLQYIREQRLFTGSWEENLGRRTARVQSILKWIANTFDASKCAKGSVNVGKFAEWARKKFPHGLVGGKRRLLTEEGEVIEVSQNIRVSTRFIACFLAVAEFGLLIDKNQDGTLPHRRAEQLWESLFAKGLLPVRFCARKWAVCRELLVEQGIIRIVNREYHAGKAMEWDVGMYFPGLGLWKGTRQRGLGGSARRKRRTTTRRHNTWLRQQPVQASLLLALARSRAPPGGKAAMTGPGLSEKSDF
jgi:hypothetical protein